MIKDIFFNKKKKQKGFTLLEFLIYITILAAFLGVFVLSTVNILRGRSSTIAMESVMENAQYALDRISASFLDVKDIGFSALEFNGIDNYVEIPHHDSLNLPDILSITAWFKTDSGERMTILSKDHRDYEIAIDQQSAGVTRVLAWYGNGTLFTETYLDVNQNLANNQWQHLTVILDKGNGRTDFYVNGIHQGHDTGTALTGNKENDLYLGARTDASQFWDGFLDDIRLFSRALEGSEIQQIMDKETITTGLVANWRMDEGTGQIIYDSVIFK